MSVCIDCCVQLDRCSNFFEKTNQAQSLLRRLVIDRPKVEPQVDLNYVEKSVDFPKEEEEAEVDDGMAECQLNDNYVDDEEEGYFNDEQNNEAVSDNDADKFEPDEIPAAEKDDGGEIQTKKITTGNKQTKKRIKRRSQAPKIEELELGIGSDIDDEGNEIDAGNKSSVKIPDNYMTGNERILIV